MNINKNSLAYIELGFFVAFFVDGQIVSKKFCNMKIQVGWLELVGEYYK